MSGRPVESPSADDLRLLWRLRMGGTLLSMDRDSSIVMLDPATDEVLAECSGPDADGRCPVSDRPPYLCAGLHLVGTVGSPAHEVSVTVTTMEPGRCPLAGAAGLTDRG